LFFSVSIGKQPRYVLAVLPPLAILLARAIARRLGLDASTVSLRRDRLVGAAGVLSGLVLCAFGFLLYRAQILLHGVSAEAVLGAVAGLTASGGLVALVAVSRRQHRLPQALVVGAVVATLSVQYVVLSRPGQEPVQVMADLVHAASPSSQQYGRYGVFVRNLVFYMERPHVDLSSVEQVAVFLRSSEPVLAVVAETHLQAVKTSGVAFHEIGRVSYLNTGNLRLSTLLWPDPARHLQTIVLVSNRPAGPRRVAAR
jgi:4-amino-4-deoxy-L-arabinose transferase-like glycosyltransferase